MYESSAIIRFWLENSSFGNSGLPSLLSVYFEIWYNISQAKEIPRSPPRSDISKFQLRFCRGRVRVRMHDHVVVAAWAIGTTPSSTTLMQPRFPLLTTLLLKVRPPCRLSAIHTARNPPAGLAMSHGSPMVGFSRTSDHSPTSLARWSILNQPLPARETIKTVHIYDFDNTCERTRELALGVVS